MTDHRTVPQEDWGLSTITIYLDLIAKRRGTCAA